MLSKYWKKIGMVIIIVACVFNVMIKLINKLSFDKEMLSSAQYVYDNQAEEEKNAKSENHENQNTEKQNNENQKKQK